MPDLAWFPRVLPLASWAPVGSGPIRAQGLPCLPRSPPAPAPALLLPLEEGQVLHVCTGDPEPGLTWGCSGQAAWRRQCRLHV